jgi:hypothetical protein
VDSSEAEHTDGVLAALGVVGSGKVSTPTTLVGTQIIHGSDANGVLSEVEAQRSSGDAK